MKHKFNKILSMEDELSLLKKYQDKGDAKAFNLLIVHNTDNVKNLAYAFYKKNNSIDIKELCSIGNEVLVKTIQNFDHTKGFRIYAYLKRACHNTFVRAVNLDRNIVLPENKYLMYGRISTGQIIPTEKQLRDLGLYGNNKTIPIQLDEPNEEGFDFELIDEASEDDIQINDLKDEISHLMNFLSKDERYIINNFFGLKSTPKIIIEIAEDLNISSGQVSKLKSEALNKLKKNWY